MSGSTTLGTQSLVPGFNGFSFLGMTTGTVSVKVINSDGTTVISGTGSIAVSRRVQSAKRITDWVKVVSTAALCNYNFQVVGLA
jgi:glucan endo-1,3-alpha-glucosidase